MGDLETWSPLCQIGRERGHMGIIHKEDSDPVRRVGNNKKEGKAIMFERRNIPIYVYDNNNEIFLTI